MPDLDGNVLAGPSLELFAFDLTTVDVDCASCSAAQPLAQARVYGAPMGLVARCYNCDEVLLTIVERATDRLIRIRGVQSIRQRTNATN